MRRHLRVDRLDLDGFHRLPSKALRLHQGVKEQVLLQIFQSYDVNGDQACCKADGKVYGRTCTARTCGQSGLQHSASIPSM